MCTHEIWTYPECGCTIDHHRPCPDISDVPTPSSGSTPSKYDADCPKSPAFLPNSSRSDTLKNGIITTHVPMTTSPLHLPPSPCPTPPDSYPSTDNDSHPEDYYHSYLHHQTPRRTRRTRSYRDATVVDSRHCSTQGHDPGSPTADRHLKKAQNATTDRLCSVNHTTNKTFLEPICDDCLLDELGIEQTSGSGLLPCVNRVGGGDKSLGDKDEKQTPEDNEDRGRARHTRNGSGLIWSSDVQIEITPSPTASNPPAGGLISEDIEAFNPPATSSPVALSDPIDTELDKPGIRKRSLPFTHDPSKRLSSSIDLARRRPWLVKELEAYIENGADTERPGPQGRVHRTDTEILESSVEVEVLDDSGLHNALEPQLSSSASHSPTSPTYRFPSTQFPHAPSLTSMAPGTTLSAIAEPPRHRSAFSSSTFAADADDESSLHASSPIPSAVLSPNVTHRRPRPRLTTKALRRRGMDISRSSFALRISSRWTSGEKECLREFKNDLLGRSPKQQEKLAWSDKAMGSNPNVVLGSKCEQQKDRMSEVGVKIGGGSTPNDKSKTQWSQEILEDLDNVGITQGRNNAISAEAEDAADLDVDPAQPAPIKTHRDDDPIETKAGSDDNTTMARGRLRSLSPVKTILTRFAEAQHGGKTWAKGVLGDLRRSLSRDPRGRGHRPRDGGEQNPDAGCYKMRAVPAESATPGVCTLRAVVDSSEDIARAQERRVRSQASRDTDSAHRGSADTSASEPSGPGFKANMYIHPTASQSIPANSESWQAHLSYDLILPRNSKKHILGKAGMSKSEVRLPHDVGMERQGSEPERRNSSAATLNRNFMSRSSPLLPSAEYGYPIEGRYQYETTHCDDEVKRRLLSTSSAPSIPVTASSMSSRTWVGHTSGSGSGSSAAPGSANWKWEGERLASIVSSSEIEVDDELVGNPWRESNANNLVNAPAEQQYNQISRNEGTTMKDVLEDSEEGVVTATTTSYHHTDPHLLLMPAHTPEHHEEKQSRPRNPTPSSAPTFRFKPQPCPQPTLSKSAHVLTRHPLSTPVRISTPNRPILPLRTSSLSSPPMSTPTRIALPASKTTLTYSPTEIFACIWKRYLCAGFDGRGDCGRVAEEVVVSCICGARSSRLDDKHGQLGKGGVEDDEVAKGKGPGVKGNEVVCRSTAPVVRYVENRFSFRQEDDGQSDDLGSEGDVRRVCEHCRVRA